MKKLMKGLLACFFTAVCVFATGCSLLFKFDKAEENLRSHGYTIEIGYENEELEYVAVERYLLAVRGEAHIALYEFEKTSTAKALYKYIISEYEIAIEECEAEIEFYEHILKKQEDKLFSNDIREIEDEIKELEMEIADIEKERDCIGRMGKYVWVASNANVIKDMK